MGVRIPSRSHEHRSDPILLIFVKRIIPAALLRTDCKITKGTIWKVIAIAQVENDNGFEHGD